MQPLTLDQIVRTIFVRARDGHGDRRQALRDIQLLAEKAIHLIVEHPEIGELENG